MASVGSVGVPAVLRRALLRPRGGGMGDWAPEWDPTAAESNGVELVPEQGALAKDGLLGGDLGATGRPVERV